MVLLLVVVAWASMAWNMSSEACPLHRISQNRNQGTSTQQLKCQLRTALRIAALDAETAFTSICNRVRGSCTDISSVPTLTSEYPALEINSEADEQCRLSHMYQVTSKYNHLVSRFADDLKAQNDAYGPHSDEVQILNRLQTRPLHTVLHRIKAVLGRNITNPSPFPDIINHSDLTMRNALNVRLLACLGTTLQEMASYYDTLCC